MITKLLSVKLYTCSIDHPNLGSRRLHIVANVKYTHHVRAGDAGGVCTTLGGGDCKVEGTTVEDAVREVLLSLEPKDRQEREKKKGKTSLYE